MSRKGSLLATGIVVAHLLIGVIHTVAHDGLGVGLTRFQDLFVQAVYVGLPLVAAVLVWTPLARAGAVLLAASLAASLAFGVWYHFIFVSPDHVAHLPDNGPQFLFQATAVLMSLVDAVGLGVAIGPVRETLAR